MLRQVLGEHGVRYVGETGRVRALSHQCGSRTDRGGPSCRRTGCWIDQLDVDVDRGELLLDTASATRRAFHAAGVVGHPDRPDIVTLDELPRPWPGRGRPRGTGNPGAPGSSAGEFGSGAGRSDKPRRRPRDRRAVQRIGDGPPDVGIVERALPALSSTYSENAPSGAVTYCGLALLRRPAELLGDRAVRGKERVVHVDDPVPRTVADPLDGFAGAHALPERDVIEALGSIPP